MEEQSNAKTFREAALDCHTPSVTVRRIVNTTALLVADAGAMMKKGASQE